MNVDVPRNEVSCVLAETAIRDVLLKKMFLKISQYSRETTWVGVFFVKLQALGIQLY